MSPQLNIQCQEGPKEGWHNTGTHESLGVCSLRSGLRYPKVGGIGGAPILCASGEDPRNCL